jgi:hypothetical protein
MYRLDKKRPTRDQKTPHEFRRQRDRATKKSPIAIVPVEVTWRGPNGLALKEEASARQVNENGGFLKMSTHPAVGTRVTLVNFLTAQTAEARVLAAPDSRSGVASGIIVELVVPSETFWGIDLQVNKTIVELQNLENALKAQDIDLRLLREFRTAVDNLYSVMDILRQCRMSASCQAEDQEMLSDLRLRTL